ncbi:MAG: FAD-binding protein [Alphaproteobacteria bacterium]|nr:FAD-binding protein [Alphaproteobacteria bacterium]
MFPRQSLGIGPEVVIGAGSNGVAKIWDVIVCGAGTAGMPAAIFAARRGARVIAIEHAPAPGGTLHVAAGQISAAGTRLQREKGIVDSPDRHYDDILRISEGTTTREFARLAVDHAADTLHWLLDLGWRPLPEHPVLFGHNPYSVPRTYWGPNAGVDILNAIRPVFMDEVRKGRIEIRLETEVVDLIQEEGGKVNGIIGRDRFGQRERIRGRNTLLLTGGFGASSDFPDYSGGFPGYGWAWPTCRGAGLRLALAAGGVLKHRDHFLPRFAGVPNPFNPLRVERYTETAPARRPPWEIYVTAEGHRFVCEDDLDPHQRERALLRVRDLTFWVVYDEAIRVAAPPLFDRPPEGGLEAHLNRHPAFVRADSVEELALRAGIAPAALKRTIAEYNAGVAAGRDPTGRRHLPRPIAEPPFYAIKHHGVGSVTIPGIAVDRDLRVIRADGSPIANLYAAGEMLGMGLHSGGAFVGGMGLMPALTYGRLLGERMVHWDEASAAAD